MASSNRHWPSMFKSKPCNTHHHHHHHHQWQHDVNSSLMPNGCQKSSYTSGCEERSPEPKPRWNPRPEQIRILEAIFNSGMVNPPRDEIRKIRAQLQEYGQVGDANVFYWFQNRKSRSKHKQRQLQSKAQIHDQQNPPPISPISTTTLTPPTSSSSSSDKSSPNSADKSFSVGSKHMMDLSNSPTTSVNQPFLQTHSEFLPEHFFFPVQQTPPGATATSFTQGFCFPDIINVSQAVDQAVAPFPSLFLSDLQAINNYGASKKVEDEKMKLQQQLSYTYTTAPSAASIAVPSTVHQGQGVGESGGLCATKSTVLINDVAFEVSFEVEAGPFNVREAFGVDAALIHSSGQPVLTSEWGVTLEPLQSGAFYYLLRTLTPSHENPIDLI